MYPQKAVTKTSLAMDFLSLFKVITTKDVLRIRKHIAMMSGDGKCSESLVWKALRKLREETGELTYNYSEIQRLLYDMKWVLELFHIFLLKPRKLSTKEVRRLDLIEEYVNKLSEIEGFGEYVRYLREVEGVEIDDLGVPTHR